MNGIMYMAAGPGVHPTVVLLHGFPGNEQNLDLAQSIRRAGWNVLYFHYRGAWGSEGTFSFGNAIEDTYAAINFLRDPVNYIRFRVDTSKIVLVGHSMGGFMAAYVAAHPNDPPKAAAIAGVVMISPWNLGRTAELLADKPENQKQIADALAEWRGYQFSLHGFTAEGGLTEARQNAKAWELTGFAAPIVASHATVLLTYGTYEDNRVEGFALLQHALESEAKNASAKVTVVTLPTDHAYSDHRIALQSAVVKWLQEIARK
jgi:pimeloyl-ACP methyl ester carboxylesterase